MKLIVVSQEGEAPGEAELIKALLAEGLDLFHIRKPGWEEGRLLSLLDFFTPGELNRIVIHDHFKLLEQRLVSGFHLSESKRNSLKNGELEVPGMPLSSSFHNVDDISCENLPLRYGFIGPVFDSISKSGYKGRTVELIPSTKKFPVIAIGGVNSDNITSLREMNFDGAALCGAIWNSADPVKSFKEIKKICHQ